MAFSPGIRQTLYNSALGMARQAAGSFDPAAAARLLRLRNPAITNSYIDYYNLTRSAGLAYERGVALRPLGATALPTRSHPIDPTLDGAPNRFRYRVVVRDGSPTSPDYYETLVLVDDNARLDGDTIRARAIAIAQAQRAANTESPRARTAQAPTAWVGIIVSAGRQY